MKKQNNLKLIVFPTSISFISKIRTLLIKKFTMNNIKIYEIISEKLFLVFDVDDPVKASNIAINFLGIEKAGIAVNTETKFSSIVDKIVSIGKKITRPNEKFIVKVFSNNIQFVERDLEFASTGKLISELSDRNCRPASSDTESTTAIFCYITNSKNSYIFYNMFKGLGGVYYAKNKKRIFCTYYNDLSLYCIYDMIKIGFIPDVLMIFFSYNDLKNKLKNFYNILKLLPNKKYVLHLLYFPLKIMDEKILSLIDCIILEFSLISSTTTNILLSLNGSIHPNWLIEKYVKYYFNSNKIPWLPFITKDVYNYKFAFDIIKFNEFENNDCYCSDQQKYLQSYNNIISLVNKLSKNIKSYSFYICPNYIHHIINSVNFSTHFH